MVDTPTKLQLTIVLAIGLTFLAALEGIPWLFPSRGLLPPGTLVEVAVMRNTESSPSSFAAISKSTKQRGGGDQEKKVEAKTRGRPEQGPTPRSCGDESATWKVVGKRVEAERRERGPGEPNPLRPFCLQNRRDTSLQRFADKAGMKVLMQSWVQPGTDGSKLRFAKDLALVHDAREITLLFLLRLPNAYMMKGTAGNGKVIRVQGGRAECAKAPCGQHWPAGGAFDAAAQGGDNLEATKRLLPLLRKSCQSWLEASSGGANVSWWLSGTRPACQFEEFLKGPSAGRVEDLKIFIFGGRPAYLQSNTHRIRRKVMTVEGTFVEEVETTAKRHHRFSNSGAFLHRAAKDEAMHLKLSCEDPDVMPRLNITSGTLAQVVKIAAGLSAHVQTSLMRLDLRVLSDQELAFGKLVFTVASCMTEVQDEPALLDSLYAWSIRHPAEALSSECVAGIAQELTCGVAWPTTVGGAGGLGNLTRELEVVQRLSLGVDGDSRETLSPPQT